MGKMRLHTAGVTSSNLVPPTNKIKDLQQNKRKFEKQVSAASNQKVTTDDARGMAWWNNATRRERFYWLDKAQSARPLDAWREYQRYCLELGRKKLY